MDLFFRFQEALKTPLGDLLIFLVLTVLTLGFFYLYFWIKFAKSRHLLTKYFLEFKKVEKQLKEITFIEMGLADVFGKAQVVAFIDGRYGKSILFYPELSTQMTVHRFRNYHLALRQAEGNYFPKNKILVQNNLLVDIETQYIKRDGTSLIQFSHFSRDPAFTLSEKELFLMDLAHRLEALHQIKTEEGESLYHGFLLPQSFYLNLDLVKKISQTHLAYHGAVFALGPESFCQWIQQILRGNILIDSKIKKDLEQFLFILAPEQKDLNRCHQVGLAVDFYAFGALSVYLFTEESFDSLASINFEKIPIDWQPFIRECLHENPDFRPHNFLELKEYFSSAEFQLSQDLFSDEAFSIEPPRGDSFHSLKSFFDQAHKVKGDNPYFNETWHRGYQAIREKSWEEAYHIFQEMMKQDPHAFNAHLGLALTYFYKGEQEKAKFHYLQAKKIDDKKISSFHRLIAFDV